MKPIAKAIEQFIENGDLPESFRAGGRSIHISTQLWAGPKDGDHERLTDILRGLELVEYLPKTVNSQSLSAFVREHLDPDALKPIEERLASDEPKPMDPRLLAALKLSEKRTLRYPKSA